jgi:hypothetical protein
MGFGIGDFLHAWEWVERRKPRVIRNFRRGEPARVAGVPCPRIERISFHPVCRVCETIPIIVSARNIGADAVEGGITVSFPDFATNENGVIIVALSERGIIGSREAGDELLSSDRGFREAFSARHMMREASCSPWESRGALDLRIELTPLREGPLKFHVTVWSASDGWASIQRNPHTSDVRDQQNHTAYAFAINVTPTQ